MSNRITIYNPIDHLFGKSIDDYKVIEDQIGFKSKLWPHEMRKLFCATHLQYDDRYSLTVFLLFNGLSPELIANWYLSRNMLSDLQAKTDVAGVFQRHANGYSKDKILNKKYHLMSKAWVIGEKAYMHNPLGLNAKEIIGVHFWDTAITMLTNSNYRPFWTRDAPIEIKIVPLKADDWEEF